MWGKAMRASLMQWVGRLVAVVFALGVASLVAAIVLQVRQAEGVPPMSVFLGVTGLAMLILLAGGCLALISIATSARQSAEALRRMSLRGGELRAVGPATEAAAPFTPTSFAAPAAAPQQPAAVRPARPAGRSLVAER